MTVVDTSTSSTATAYSNQRKLDRCQNGVLWAVVVGAGGATGNRIASAYYSTDDGATWALDGYIVNGSGFATNNYTKNLSLFIDADDYAHVVFKDNEDGRTYYRRGAPNAGRTSWTWSSPVLVFSTNTYDYCDLVAHAEGSGWAVHIVSSWSGGRTQYQRVDIDSGGVASLSAIEFFTNHGTSSHTWPSIDFNHTGDGKTVAGGTPHLFVAWSAGDTGSGLGIRFRKATYSGGSWTWGTEREIDSTRYVSAPPIWINCLFDGTRVIMAGCLVTGGGTDLLLYERDAADTTTTTHILVASATTDERLYYGSSSYDGNANVYLFGANQDEAAGSKDLVYRKWDRAAASLGAEVVVDAGVGDPHVSMKRGYSDGKAEWVYTDGTASPYDVTYGSIDLFTQATIKYWNGSAWTAKPLYRWNGSSWAQVEDSDLKYWDGAAWTQV